MLGPQRFLGASRISAIYSAACGSATASARGFIWSWLRRHLDLRATPELLFRPDRSMEHAAHIQSLLASLKTDDADARERD